MNLQDKVDRARPVLGYRLASVRAAGWKVNEEDKDGNEGRWVTMSGTPVFIKDGEDPKEAAARTFKDKPLSKSQPVQAQKKEGFFKRAWREAKEDISNYLNPKVPNRPNKPEPPARTGTSTKLQRIRDVGLGAKETVAELFFKKHVDDLYNGKMSTADKVDDLMKKGVIKTGAEKPETVRERAIRDFDKAVALREQQTADRLTSGEGKRAYTDKTLRAGLGKGETLAERYFAGHVDDLYDGNTSVTAKVDSLIESGELGFGRGDKGFVKMRETAIKDFTRALNLRESHDVRLEKQKLEDAKPKKLTKREQQAEWSPSEEEIAATGPVVGTGWKRNMAENQPRDADGKWTDGGGGAHDLAKLATTRERDFVKKFPYLYHITNARPETLAGIAVGGLKPSATAQYAGTGLYLATSPEDTQYYHKLGSVGSTLFRVKTEHVLAKQGLYSAKNARGVEYDETNGEVLSPKGVDSVLLQQAMFVNGKIVGWKNFTSRSDWFKLMSLGRKLRTNAFDPNQPRDEQGRWTGVGWHGTRREFDVFDTKAAPASRTGAAADQPPFIYFAASPEKAVPYAVSKRSGDGRPRVIQANLRMDNPLDITKAVKRGRRKGLPFGEAKRIALSELTNAHDGFIYAGDTYNSPEYAVRDVSQIQVITQPKQNTFNPAQPRDDTGKWALSGSKLVGALTSLYSAQSTPPADGKGWLRPDGLFVDGGNTSHVAMLRAAYGERKGKAPAFAEDMYRMAFRAGLVRYDRHAGVIEISGTPTEDQKTALRKMFDGLETYASIEVEVFRTPETRYYSEQDRASHRRWLETSPDSLLEKVDAFYGSKGDGYVSPFAQFRGNAFDPNQPRDPDGKWTGGTLNFSNEPERVGGFTKDVAVRRSTVMKGEERVTTWHNPDGSQITDPKLVARAEQLNGTMATAPNVKGAWLNPNLDSPLLAIAFDAKDRKQYIYSREFVQKNAEAKFKIVEQMEKDLPVMRKQAAADRKAGTPEAFLFKLEDLTCIRVGSDKDTGAEKKAYGLTTLRGEHVKVEGDLIKLAFPAKGGESGSYTVKDRELATFITERKAVNGDGPLWPDVTAGKFNAYLKELDPTADTPVTAHKFRHYHATRIAAEVVAKYEGTELNPKAFTRVQKEACEKAAAHLSNTWTVAREKYINPTVWGRLTVKAG